MKSAFFQFTSSRQVIMQQLKKLKPHPQEEPRASTRQALCDQLSAVLL